MGNENKALRIYFISSDQTIYLLMELELKSLFSN